ncbi:MAG: SRPBCC domain-containing protein [Methyloceanibacter sp.]|nr:SRPBCC domain-containing protein [Methyloceanibacter sp.]
MSAVSELTTKPSLSLKRRFNATPEKVYAAWTDPAQIAQWFGPPHVDYVEAQADAREGGHYRIFMRDKDGDEHDVSGVYRKVIPNQELVFTWAWKSTPERESLVTILIRPDGDGTLFTLTHEQFFDEVARDNHNKGWTACLDALEEFFG